MDVNQLNYSQNKRTLKKRNLKVCSVVGNPPSSIYWSNTEVQQKCLLISMYVLWHAWSPKPAVMAAWRQVCCLHILRHWHQESCLERWLCLGCW